MNSRDNNGGGAGALLGLIAAAIAVFVILISIEVGRIYAARAWGKDTTTAKLLWTALGVFALIAAVGWQYVNYPPTQAGAIYVLSWSFLAYVILIEACDWYERRFDPPEPLTGHAATLRYVGSAPSSTHSRLPDATLEDVLGPWHSEVTPPGVTAIRSTQ